MTNAGNPGNLILAELQKQTKELEAQTRLLAHLSQQFGKKIENDEYLTTKQAAEFVKRSTETIRRWIQDDKINGIKLNRGSDKDRYLIPKQSLEKLLADSQLLLKGGIHAG